MSLNRIVTWIWPRPALPSTPESVKLDLPRSSAPCADRQLDACLSAEEYRDDARLDVAARRLLDELELMSCADDTSVCLWLLARRVSVADFVNVLLALTTVQALWRELELQRPGRRIRDHMLDEFVWATRNVVGPHTPPEKVAEALGIPAVHHFRESVALRLAQ